MRKYQFLLALLLLFSGCTSVREGSLRNRAETKQETDDLAARVRKRFVGDVPVESEASSQFRGNAGCVPLAAFASLILDAPYVDTVVGYPGHEEQSWVIWVPTLGDLELFRVSSFRGSDVLAIRREGYRRSFLVTTDAYERYAALAR